MTDRPDGPRPGEPSWSTDETIVGRHPGVPAGKPRTGDGSTLRLPTPTAPPPSAQPQSGPPRSRRTPRLSRRAKLAIFIPLAIIVLLIGADRVAAAYAANRVASQIQGYGFPVKPGVSIEGFPFLTQVIGKHLDGVDISAPKFPAGPVTASIAVRASDISLNSGYSSGTIGQVTGTGLISFSSLANAADVAGAPGLKLSRAGPHKIKITVNLEILSASAIARVARTGPNSFSIRIVSTNGIPGNVLGPIRHFSVRIPKLPAGITVQSVNVTGKGVAARIAGSNIPFSN